MIETKMRHDHISFKDVPILEGVIREKARYEVRGIADIVIDGQKFEGLKIIGLRRASCAWDLVYTHSVNSQVGEGDLLAHPVGNLKAFINYAPYGDRTHVSNLGSSHSATELTAR